MYPFKNPPAPTNRIWAACYMDSVTECFEIRTEAKTPGGIFTLYHKEYPIGTALTEFLYADLKVFPAHLGNIKTCLKEIRAGNDVDTQFLQLFSIALYWLRCSPAFAPLAASIQRQQLYYEQRNDIQDFFADTLNTERAEDFTQFILAEYIRRDLRFRVCKFCGRCFGIMGNTRLEFCDRLIDGSTKTCKEMGSLRLYEKRKLEEPAIKEYKRSYKAHNARIRYGLMTREEFNTWSQEARRKRDDCVAGKLSLEEFVAWLDSDRQR